MDSDVVTSRANLVEFVRKLSDRVDSCPNHTLPNFLEALSAWLADSDGYYRYRGEPVPDQPSWQLIASALDAATIYE